MLALPLLVTLGAAIGNSRIIRATSSWQESAAIYAAVVAQTGAMKTPVLKLITEPLRKAQSDARRTWTSDTTVERFVEILRDHPRGLLIYTDELTGFVRSMNQYKKGGGDREFYLSCWSGSPYTIDRKQTGPDNKKVSIHVARPFVSFVGCIPPAMLGRLTLGESLEDGFLQRILFTEPEAVPVRLMKEGIDSRAIAAYAHLVADLLALDGQAGDPRILDLTPEAWDLYQSWHDSHCEYSESRTVSDALKGFYSKHRAYCLRLALIHAVSSDTDAYQISSESVRAAIAQIEYFKEQSAKVVSRLAVGVGTVGKSDTGNYGVWKCQEDVKRIIGKGGIRKKREIQRSLNYDAHLFNQAWDNLVNPLRVVTDSQGYLSLSDENIIIPRTLPSADTPTTDTGEDDPPDVAA